MLVLRALSTLLVGYAVSTLGAPAWKATETAVQLAQAGPVDWNESDVESLVGGRHADLPAATAVPPRPVRLEGSQRASLVPRGQSRWLQKNQDPPPPPATIPPEENKTQPVCPGCGGNDGGVSAIFVTTTRTSTITVFTGPPITSVVITTATDTLTFVDPGQSGVNTVTVTVTSFCDLAKRTELASPGSILTDIPLASERAERRAEPTITSTIEADIFITVTSASVVFATRTNTIFVSVTSRPNAQSTVFMTTTICTTSPLPPSSTTTPGATSTPGAPNTSTLVPPGPTSTDIPPPPPTSTPLPPPPPPPPPPSSTTSTSPVSTPPTSSSTTPLSTTDTLVSMMTGSLSGSLTGVPTPTGPTFPFPPTGTATSTPIPPSGLPGSSLSADQIAGIVLGTIAGIVLLALAVLALRWCVRRRRSRIAEMRQRLSPTLGAGASAAVGAGRMNSPGNSATSGLTGEGEVRIIIRPARSRQWPMPPGHGGPTYSFFVEETTTGDTTPAGDPAAWSNASESGSVRVIARKPLLSRSGPGTYTGTGSSSGGRTMSAREPASGTATAAAGHDGGFFARDAAGNSLVSIGWGTSVGGRSEGSNNGVRTNLSPPPPIHRTGNNGWGGRWGQGSGYPGSWGIGRAV